MSEWDIYWLLMLDSINEAFVILCIISALLTGLALLFTSLEGVVDKYKGWLKLGSAVFLVTLFTATFLPSTKQMAAIMVTPKVINNEKIQQIPERVLDILGLSLDKAEEILKPKEKK